MVRSADLRCDMQLHVGCLPRNSTDPGWCCRGLRASDSVCATGFGHGSRVLPPFRRGRRHSDIRAPRWCLPRNQRVSVRLGNGSGTTRLRECRNMLQVGQQPNPRVQAPHSRVTARAYCGTGRATRRAPDAHRWAYRMRALPFLVLIIAASAFGCARDMTADRKPITCEVHGVALRTKVVEFSYGLQPAPSADELKARRGFPHAVLSWYCGCDVGACESFLFRRAKVWSCPACDAAEEAWWRTQPYNRQPDVGGLTPNRRVNPPVRPATALAQNASAAPVRPAGYAHR